MNSNIAIKNLINKFGLTNKLKLKNDKLLNIYKIPNHYSNYKRLSLYFGDWRIIKSDCVYVGDRKQLDRLLVLSKITSFNVPKETIDLLNDEGLIECIDYVENCRFIYFGSLNSFTPSDNLKSLIVPLDLLNFKLLNYDMDSIKLLIDSLENMDTIDKIVLCTCVNEIWITFHRFLKYNW